jgi:hypothetical protein
MDLPLACANPHCRLIFETWDDIRHHLNDPFLSCVRAVPPPHTNNTDISNGFVGPSLDLNPDNLSTFHSTAPTYQISPAHNGYQNTAQESSQAPQLNARYQQYHPHSAWTYGQAPNVLEQMNDDQYAPCREKNMFYPFQGAQEWDLAKFLNETLNLTQIDQFLKLDWVSEPHTLLFYIVLDFYHRSESIVYLSNLHMLCDLSSKFCQQDPNGIWM